MADVKFAVLGPIQVFEEAERLPIGGPKQRAALALLITHVGESVSTDALVQGVYGDDASSGVRRSVQTYISNLRGVLGDAVAATGSGYVLNADRQSIDAIRFEDLVRTTFAMDDPQAVSSGLREALALWRGHPFSDIDGHSEIATERIRLNELRATALERRVDADLELGRHRDVIAELESLTKEYPLREHFRAQQMIALYRSGRQAEALRSYEKARAYLVDETGLDPSQELRDLERRILEQDPALAYATGPSVVRRTILVADVANPRVLKDLTPEARADLVRFQGDAVTRATRSNEGRVFAHRGSAIYAVFESVEDAARAAGSAQQALAERSPMRMAISSGEVELLAEGLIQGSPVQSGANLVASANEGQILVSSDASRALRESESMRWKLEPVGHDDTDPSGDTLAISHLLVDGLSGEFPPLRADLSPPPLPVESSGLPGYELRSVVGTGPFGVVRRAYQPTVGREVAIKIIRPEYSNDPEFIRQFEVQAQLVARLEHPHIVPLHDYWRTPDGAYLVMRWLDGGTLQDRLAGDGLTIEDATRMVAEIGPALDFAHRHGVVHGEIKPSNVLFDSDGGAYLADFGIASDVALRGTGSVQQDIQALASMLQRCIAGSLPQPLSEMLGGASDGAAFIDVRTFVAAWDDALGRHEPTQHRYTPTRNPYKGLTAFREPDAADFHGRDDEVAEIADALASRPLVAIVGPSGIGKSSVVRAGLVPALRSGAIPGSDQWLITDMFPGSYPFEELASALIRVADHMPTSLEEDLRRDERGLLRSVNRYAPEGRTILLIIDQFEELFTVTSDDERAAFLSMLATTLNDRRSRIRVVLTMRADFFDRPLRFSDLGEAFRSGTIPLSAPDDAGLRALVENPAAGVGVSFEPGLVDRVVGDVKHQPGALPLLEFAVTELFARRESDVLTLDDYEKSGGVLGALGRRAEAIYAALTEGGREVARELFLRLVNVAESGRDTRRRVRLTEFEHLGLAETEFGPVLEAFTRDRLLTLDRDAATRGTTVEVAHEAILTEWPRLAVWIDDYREDLLLRSRLAAAVADWESADRAPAYLFSGGRLSQHEAWTAETDLTLTIAERGFLDESRAAEDERTRKRRTTRRRIVWAFASAAAVSLALAVVAVLARNDAQEKADSADRAATVALAQHARALIEVDPPLAVAVAAEAQARSDVPETQRVVVKANAALRNSRLIMAVGHPAAVYDVAFNHDGTRFATASADTTARVWDAASGARLLTLDDHGAVVLRVAFNNEGTIVATASPDRTAKLWDAANGELLRTLDHTDVVVDVAFSPDGTKIATASDHLRIWDVTTGDLMADLEGHTGPVWAVSFSSDGTRIATASGDGTAKTWDVETGAVLRTFRGHADHVLDVAYSHSGSRLVTASRDATARVWDADNGGEALLTLAGSSGSVRGVAFGSDDSTVVTINQGGDAVVWDATTGEDLVALAGHTNVGRGVAVNSDGTIIATASADQTARLWRASTGEGLLALDTESDAVRAVSFSPDDAVVVAAQSDGRATVWEAGTGRFVGRLSGHTGPLWDVAASPDGTRIATASDDGTAMVWDVATLVEEFTLSGHDSRVRGVAFSPDGSMVATASDDGTAMTWSASNGELIATTAKQDGPVRDVVFNNDGTRLVTTGADGAATIWDPATGEQVINLVGHSDLVTGVAWSHDGRRIATASADGTAKVWDATNGRNLITFAGHRGWVLGVAFNNDGTRLATGSGDGTAKIWDAQNGEDLVDLMGHEGPIWDVAFSTDGFTLATASEDGSARLWTTDPGDSCDLVRYLVTREELEAALGGAAPIACTNLRSADDVGPAVPLQ